MPLPTEGTFHDNNDLDGARTYKVTLPPNIPQGKFWSFTLYDNQTRTVPGKGFNVILRMYSPFEPFFAKTWRPSEIQRMP